MYLDNELAYILKKKKKNIQEFTFQSMNIESIPLDRGPVKLLNIIRYLYKSMSANLGLHDGHMNETEMSRI